MATGANLKNNSELSNYSTLKFNQSEQLKWSPDILLKTWLVKFQSRVATLLQKSFMRLAADLSKFQELLILNFKWRSIGEVVEECLTLYYKDNSTLDSISMKRHECLLTQWPWSPRCRPSCLPRPTRSAWTRTRRKRGWPWRQGRGCQRTPWSWEAWKKS